MRLILALILWFLPSAVFACATPVCLVQPDRLSLNRIITFDDIASGFGPGMYSKDVLALNGASFGERFAGQHLSSHKTYDRVTGPAFGPLQILPGAEGENLSVVRFSGNAVLNGYGAAGFPKRDAQGEGAIAVLFDIDQSALSFDLRGGEDGTAQVLFLRRDGSIIGSVAVAPTGEFTVAFLRTGGGADIAGFVLTNTDPQGMAIDTLRFGKPPELG